jgi:hypothetical protein
VGRGRASLMTNPDAWHSEPFTDIWYSLIYHRHRLDEETGFTRVRLERGWASETMGNGAVCRMCP